MKIFNAFLEDGRQYDGTYPSLSEAIADVNDRLGEEYGGWEATPGHGDDTDVWHYPTTYEGSPDGTACEYVRIQETEMTLEPCQHGIDAPGGIVWAAGPEGKRFPEDFNQGTTMRTCADPKCVVRSIAVCMLESGLVSPMIFQCSTRVEVSDEALQKIRDAGVEVVFRGR